MKNLENIFNNLMKTMEEKQIKTAEMVQQIANVEQELQETDEQLALLEAIQIQLKANKKELEQKLKDLNQKVGNPMKQMFESPQPEQIEKPKQQEPIKKELVESKEEQEAQVVTKIVYRPTRRRVRRPF